MLQSHLSRPPAGASFYARVFHPAFGIDSDEASHTGARFDAHTKALGRGVQELRNVFTRARDARTGTGRG
jgi:sorting nexin-9/18/33